MAKPFNSAEISISAADTRANLIPFHYVPEMDVN